MPDELLTDTLSVVLDMVWTVSTLVSVVLLTPDPDDAPTDVPEVSESVFAASTALVFSLVTDCLV